MPDFPQPPCQKDCGFQSLRPAFATGMTGHSGIRNGTRIISAAIRSARRIWRLSRMRASSSRGHLDSIAFRIQDDAFVIAIAGEARTVQNGDALRFEPFGEVAHRAFRSE